MFLVPQKLDIESGVWTDHRWLHTVPDPQPFSGLWLQQLQKHIPADLPEVHCSALLQDGSIAESTGIFVFMYLFLYLSLPEARHWLM